MKLKGCVKSYSGKSNFKIKKLRFDLSCALIVCLLPYLFLVHLFFDREDNKFQIFGEIFIHGYRNNMTMVWFFTTYLTATLLLIIFYWNTQARWRYFLLPVILSEFVSFLNVIYFSMDYYQLVISYQGCFWIITLTTVILSLDKFCFRPYSTTIIKIRVKDFLLGFSQNRMNRVISKAQETIALKKEFSIKTYLYQVYHIKAIIEANELKYAKNNINYNLKLNLLMGLGILVLTLLLFADTVFPIKSKYVDIFGLRIDSFGFNNIESFLWYFSRKVVMILLLILWLFDSRHWWRWVILSPLILYTYQFWEIFTSELALEGFSNMVLIPLVVVTITGVLSIIKYIKKNNIAKNMSEMLNLELEDSIDIISNSRNKI